METPRKSLKDIKTSRRGFFRASAMAAASWAAAACAPKPTEQRPTASVTTAPIVEPTVEPSATAVPMATETPKPVDFEQAEKDLLPWGVYGREEISFEQPYTMVVPKELAQLAGVRAENDLRFDFQPEPQKKPNADIGTIARMDDYNRYPLINRVMRTFIPGVNVVEGHSQIVKGKKFEGMPEQYPVGWMPLEWMAKLSPAQLNGQYIELEQNGKKIKLEFFAAKDIDDSVYEGAFGSGQPDAFKAHVSSDKKPEVMPIPSVYMRLDQVGFSSEDIDSAALVIDTCNGKYNPFNGEYNKVRIVALKVVEQK